MSTVKTVGIQFKEVGKKYYFNPQDMDLKIGELVVVDTIRGYELGQVIEKVKEIEESDLISELKNVIRIASAKDLEMYEKNKKDRESSLQRCKFHIKNNELDMKLLDCEYTLNRDKIIFYYNAEGRVDFRQLVKDLAQEFKVRIELRQVGVRDGAKFLGGIGHCGRVLCCNGHLREFDTVSIKMAKNQNLALSPQKISGICGKLLCCIKYENETYTDLKREMPDVGDEVTTPSCESCPVIDVNLLTKKIKVSNPKNQTVEEWYASEIKGIKRTDKKNGTLDDSELSYLEKD